MILMTLQITRLPNNIYSVFSSSLNAITNAANTVVSLSIYTLSYLIFVSVFSCCCGNNKLKKYLKLLSESCEEEHMLGLKIWICAWKENVSLNSQLSFMVLSLRVTHVKGIDIFLPLLSKCQSW